MHKAYFLILIIILGNLPLSDLTANSTTKDKCTDFLNIVLIESYKPQGIYQTRQNDLVSPDQISHKLLKESELTRSQISYTPLIPLQKDELNEIEKRLTTGKFKSFEPVPHGHTKTTSIIVTLDNGLKAVWKPHPETPYSNYRAEVLVYQLSEVLGFKKVPITIEREYLGMKGSLQLYVEPKDPRATKSNEFGKMSLFDFLIDNRDRGGNYLKNSDGTLVYIDHGLSLIDNPHKHPLPLIEIIPYINQFLETESASKILLKLKKQLSSSKFRNALIENLGTEDANRFIDRSNFIFKYYDSFQETKSTEKSLLEMASSPTISEHEAQIILYSIERSSIKMKLSKKIVESIIDKFETNSKVLEYALNTITHANRRFENFQSILLKIIRPDSISYNSLDEITKLLNFSQLGIENFITLSTSLLKSKKIDDFIISNIMNSIIWYQYPSKGLSSLFKKLVTHKQINKDTILGAQQTLMFQRMKYRNRVNFLKIIEDSL